MVEIKKYVIIQAKINKICYNECQHVENFIIIDDKISKTALYLMLSEIVKTYYQFRIYNTHQDAKIQANAL